MLTRIFLALTGLLFLAFGLWSLTNPASMTAQLGVNISGPSGIFEMRGVYGGISLGAALLCLAGAMKANLQTPALWFLTTYMGGYMIGRTASFIAGDPAMNSSWMFAGYELITLLIAIALLRRTK